MFCSKCGNILPDYARRCDSCGAPVDRNARINRDCEHEHKTQPRQEVRNSDNAFSKALTMFLVRFANFHGRSTRADFWLVMPFLFVLQALLLVIMPEFAWMLVLFTFIPSLALCCRRLHDTGRSGKWIFWFLVPGIGWFILLILFSLPSDAANRWGQNPFD